jgi:uncharacterized protein YjhX (UPF0386 family)
LGVNTRDPYHEVGESGLKIRVVRDKDGSIMDVQGYLRNGSKYALSQVTMMDAYDQEYYYYSPPPHQSYRLWSAGPDHRTFPPWIPLDNLSKEERAWVTKWLKDDIVRFDQ